jgi:hypothetical protein
MEDGSLARSQNKVIPVGNFERIYYLKRHEARRLVTFRTLEGQKVRSKISTVITQEDEKVRR